MYYCVGSGNFNSRPHASNTKHFTHQAFSQTPKPEHLNGFLVIRESDSEKGSSGPQRSVTYTQLVTDQFPSQVNCLAFWALLGSEILGRCSGQMWAVMAKIWGPLLIKTGTKLLGARAAAMERLASCSCLPVHGIVLLWSQLWWNLTLTSSRKMELRLQCWVTHCAEHGSAPTGSPGVTRSVLRVPALNFLTGTSG